MALALIDLSKPTLYIMMACSVAFHGGDRKKCLLIPDRDTKAKISSKFPLVNHWVIGVAYRSMGDSGSFTDVGSWNETESSQLLVSLRQGALVVERYKTPKPS